MKKLLVMLATAGAVSAFAAASSKAAPAGPVSIGTGSSVVLVAEGCGRGWHRIPNGRCVRNIGPGFGACWWRRGPYGRWVMVCR